MKLGFIGAGNMASAIIGGIIKKGIYTPKEIICSTPVEAERKKAEDTFGVNTTPDNKEVVRLGFIIVDNNVRGKGYGKILINEAIKYSKEELGAKEISLGVFTNNENALHCYKSIGFKVIRIEKNVYKFYDEHWDCAEMILDS